MISPGTVCLIFFCYMFIHSVACSQIRRSICQRLKKTLWLKKVKIEKFLPINRFFFTVSIRLTWLQNGAGVGPREFSLRLQTLGRKGWALWHDQRAPSSSDASFSQPHLQPLSSPLPFRLAKSWNSLNVVAFFFLWFYTWCSATVHPTPWWPDKLLLFLQDSIQMGLFLFFLFGHAVCLVWS